MVGITFMVVITFTFITLGDTYLAPKAAALFSLQQCLSEFGRLHTLITLQKRHASRSKLIIRIQSKYDSIKKKIVKHTTGKNMKLQLETVPVNSRNCRPSIGGNTEKDDYFPF